MEHSWNIFSLLILSVGISAQDAIKVSTQTVCYLNQTLEFNRKILEAHNYYRSFHHVPPLTLDERLIESSITWADMMAFLEKKRHSVDERYGENVDVIEYNETTPITLEAIDAQVLTWYEESKNYYDGIDAFDMPRFTKMIWKATRRLGCGICSNAGNTKYFLACRYYPRGNYRQDFELNVPNLQGRHPSSASHLYSVTNLMVTVLLIQYLAHS